MEAKKDMVVQTAGLAEDAKTEADSLIGTVGENPVAGQKRKDVDDFFWSLANEDQLRDVPCPYDDYPVAVEGAQSKLFRISSVYWAAKPMLCSSQLKEHIRNSPNLSRTLEEFGCTYDRLKEKCEADQQFAIMVADGMVLLQDVILRLKVDDADALFPDNVPFVESGTSREQALLHVAQVDWGAVKKTRCDTELLKIVSKEYDNRSDLIEKKILFLSELLKDLKKDEALLRAHQVEVSFLFACWLDDAAKFFDQLPEPEHAPRVGRFKEHRLEVKEMMRFWKLYMDEAMNDNMRAFVQTYAQRFQKEQHPDHSLFAEAGVAARSKVEEGTEPLNVEVGIATSATTPTDESVARVTASPSAAERAAAKFRAAPLRPGGPLAASGDVAGDADVDESHRADPEEQDPNEGSG